MRLFVTAGRPSSKSSSRVKKILIVEDSKLVHKMYEMMLRDYELVHTYSGTEALQALPGHPDSALILLDLNMPGMSGLEFLAHIKADEAFAEIPVVIVTTEGKEEDAERGLEAGAAEYFSKPFRQEEILERVHELTEG